METEVHSISHLPCPGVGCYTIERADINLYLSKAQLLIYSKLQPMFWPPRSLNYILVVFCSEKQLISVCQCSYINYVCTYVCMYAAIAVCTYVCMYVCMYGPVQHEWSYTV